MSQTVFELAGVISESAGSVDYSKYELNFSNFNFFFWQILLIFFLVFLNAFFVAAEFAIVKVRNSQLDSLIQQGKNNAKFARSVTSHLDAYLSATQLGITFASIALGFTGEPFLHHILMAIFHKYAWFSSTISHSIAFMIAYGTIAFLHVVLGELTPKSLAIRKSLMTTLIVVRPLAFFNWLFKPLIFILNGAANIILKLIFKIDPVSEEEIVHSADELRILVNKSQESKEVTQTERDIFINALNLNELNVRDIMTPRNEVVVLDAALSFSENMKIAKESGHTRFPLVQGHLDSSLGLIHIKDVINKINNDKPNLLKVKRELELVPEMMQLDKLLRFFLDKRAHLALVVDEFGGALGIVTLDNVIAELVGDIHDEFDKSEDEVKEFVRINNNEFFVKGTLALYELEEFTDLEKLDNQDVSTVGGYVTHLFGQLPKKGDKIKLGNYLVTISQSDGRRINQMHFKKLKNNRETKKNS